MKMHQKTIFVVSLLSSFLLHAQVGIGTKNPQSTLDVDGDLRVRQLKTIADKDGGYYQLMADLDGEVYKSDSEPSSYSAYLGFDPMASTHSF